MTKPNNSKTQISEWHSFFAALMFYTRLPVPNNLPHSQEILNNSRKYFPLIGIIIGAIACVVFLVSQLIFPLSVSVALSMVATILATGAFHEDGFADSCDGLGGGWQSEQVSTCSLCRPPPSQSQLSAKPSSWKAPVAKMVATMESATLTDNGKINLLTRNTTQAIAPMIMPINGKYFLELFRIYCEWGRLLGTGNRV